MKHRLSIKNVGFRNKFWTIAFLSCSIACSDSLPPLEYALQRSGENRPEWEKVLKHYSVLATDSLKYKAACFLIENMPGHFWYESDELSKTEKYIDSVYRDTSDLIKILFRETLMGRGDLARSFTKREDIKSLNSDFLISHIDYVFRERERRPWLKELTTGQFFEHVLPYRVGREVPRLRSMERDTIFMREMAALLVYDNSRYYPYQLYRRWILPVRLKWYMDLSVGDSRVRVNTQACALQALTNRWQCWLRMLPLVTDLLPAYPDKNGRHCWTSVVDNRYPGRGEPETGPVRTGKIYRETFARNRIPLFTGREYIPPFFRNPFYEDVTSLYTTVADVNLCPEVSGKERYLYLAVFNDLSWKPVAWGERQSGKVCFKDMGIGVIYLPVVYPDGEPTAVGYPFFLLADGRPCFLNPDTIRKSAIRLYRKYPSDADHSLINRDFIQCLLEASDDISFQRKEVVGKIEAIDHLQEARILVETDRAYRYWRIVHPAYYVEIAECRLHDKAGRRLYPVVSPGEPAEMIFDDRALTYNVPARSVAWDMGKSVALSSVWCLLRNDGNNVWSGHWYELFYHSGKRWVSLGVQRAEKDWLEFGKVPSGALLWLRDLTEGKEERVFTCRDGEIRFW
ncbi:hypothetical protein [Gabonibacter chumensis]|uniref:hypothetical protein n=1 Tax=Gabonibacter chumensis TaxID=2972474 RepID=UPI0025740063|nr:hypothetical protein [Gabonibacter chumensis]MCR9011624.1 hypothetical protein [Gabonibacter chumensis]